MNIWPSKFLCGSILIFWLIWFFLFEIIFAVRNFWLPIKGFELWDIIVAVYSSGVIRIFPDSFWFLYLIWDLLVPWSDLFQVSTVYFLFFTPLFPILVFSVLMLHEYGCWFCHESWGIALMLFSWGRREKGEQVSVSATWLLGPLIIWRDSILLLLNCWNFSQ